MAASRQVLPGLAGMIAAVAVDRVVQRARHAGVDDRRPPQGPSVELQGQERDQPSARNGFPSDIGEFKRIVFTLREITTSTMIVAQ